MIAANIISHWEFPLERVINNGTTLSCISQYPQPGADLPGWSWGYHTLAPGTAFPGPLDVTFSGKYLVRNFRQLGTFKNYKYHHHLPTAGMVFYLAYVVYFFLSEKRTELDRGPAMCYTLLQSPAYHCVSALRINCSHSLTRILTSQRNKSYTTDNLQIISADRLVHVS